MRTTLTIADDLARMLERENHAAKEPMKQTIDRILRRGLAQQSAPARKRFVVQPVDTGLTREDWEAWDGMSVEEILDQAERAG